VKKPSALIDPADRLRLEASVVEAERSTAGELVVCVVGACDEYGSLGWRLGVTLAALALLAGGTIWPESTPVDLLGMQLVALLLGHALARLTPLRRALLPEALLERHVSERASAAFAEHGLTRTAGRTGVLLFVALLERRVVVLADEGIHRVLGPDESWQEVVDLATGGLRSGRAVEGLESAIRRCGEILRAHLPAAPRHLNELPNAIVLED
jgi:putative membrane protein